MQEDFDIDREIENVKAVIAELSGRLKLLMALKENGYKIVKASEEPAKDEDRQEQ